jgi:hypothetical protein
MDRGYFHAVTETYRPGDIAPSLCLTSDIIIETRTPSLDNSVKLLAASFKFGDLLSMCEIKECGYN